MCLNYCINRLSCILMLIPILLVIFIITADPRQFRISVSPLLAIAMIISVFRFSFAHF